MQPPSMRVQRGPRALRALSALKAAALGVDCVKIPPGSMHSPSRMAGSVAASGNSFRGSAINGKRNAFRDPRLHDFDAVYEEHFAFVWRTLRRYGVPEAAMDDAIQDAFLVVHSRLATFEGRSSLRTWIFGIARRIARDHRPSRAEWASADVLEALPDDSSSPLAALEAVERAHLLERLLAGLVPERREAFILVKLEEMTIQEAGEALGVNANTIYSRARTACRELEEALVRLSLRGEGP
jgi:RNA polymerase sigma-70 factor (ECF subfamily)